MKAYKKILSLILLGSALAACEDFWTNSLLHILYLKIIIEQKTKYKLALIDFIQIYSRRTGRLWTVCQRWWYRQSGQSKR